MYIIAGLGNPDRKYAGTRHNIGFDVITYLSDKYNIELSKNGFKSKLGQGFIEGEKVLLMKPQTYIIQDDIDLSPGDIRIRTKGSAGGHNGIKSIISHIGGNDFVRIKLGVGGKPEGWDLADHVLSGFDRDTEPLIRKVIAVAGEAVLTVMKEGSEAAMNKYNGLKIEM